MSDERRTVTEYRPTLDVWPFTSDGLATVPDLPAGDYELQAVGGACYWSDRGPMTATDYAATGYPCPRSYVQHFRLPQSRRLYIYNPAGVDTYLRRVG